jgi:phosphoglycerol transferase
MVLVLLWVYQDMPILYNAEKKKIELRNYYTIVSLVICGLLALQYVYYSFFTCFFLLVIGVFHSLSTRDGKYLIRCSLLIGLIAAVFLINIAPALLYQFQNGSNPVAIIRSPRESEVYGLKIIQLLLPVGGHRVPFLAEIASNYANTAPLVNENAWSALGIFGALGFLLLIFWVFFRLGRATYGTTLEQIGPVLDCLATLNLSAVFLATIGGLGAFVAYIFSFQEIRGYNRISIFIALFAILAMILILDFIYRNRCPTGNMRLLFIAVLSVLLIGAILDQTTPAYIPDYGGTAERFLKDQRFIDTIEDEVPPGSMIFQLPYMMYPENGPIHAMPDYSPTIGYLHSRTLRWSYGSMKGRPGDNWQQEVVGQDLPEMLDSLAFAGFNGIYVDSYGYSRPMEILDNLSSILHIQPVISENNRLYFFSLVDYNNRLKASMSADEWEAEVESVLQEHPYLASGRGCYSLEKTTIEDWRWCSSWGQLHLYNPTNESKMVRITTTFMSGYPEPSVLEISSPLFTDRLFITNQGTRYSKEFLLPPGHSPVTLSSEAKRVQAPGDARYLVFRMMNLGLKWL